jgi:hypothetical protein
MSIRFKSALALGILALLIIAKFVGAYFPAARIWGINQLAFMPRPVAIALISAICILWIILIFMGKSKTGNFSVKPAKGKSSNNNIAILLIGLVVIGGLFYILRDRVNLLGDSYLRIEELQKKGLARLFADTPSEALDYFVHWFTYAKILKPMKIESLVSFQIWSIIAGLIYTFTAWQIAIKLRKYDIERWLSFSWIMAWGGLMMFCGYAEEYGLAAACLLITFNFAIDYIQSGKNLIWMLLAFTIGFFMHNLAIMILPAIWYAVYIQNAASRKKGISALAGVTLLALGYMILTRLGAPEGTLLLFDSVSEPGYTLFSGPHLLDILNQLLLVSPVFLVALLFQKFRNHPKPEYNRLVIFAWITGCSSLAALLFIDPKLGMARDWDLFALPLLMFHLAIFISADWRQAGRTIKIGVAVVAVGFTFIWILTNSNQAWALKRYDQIAGMDNLRGGYNYEVLGNYYYNQKNYAASENAFARSVTCKPHQRCYVWLGHVQMWQNKYEPAEKNLLEAVRLNPTEPNALDYLSRLYFQTNRFPQAKEYLDRYAKTPEGARNPEIKPAQAYLDSLLIHQAK